MTSILKEFIKAAVIIGGISTFSSSLAQTLENGPLNAVLKTEEKAKGKMNKNETIDDQIKTIVGQQETIIKQKEIIDYQGAIIEERRTTIAEQQKTIHDQKEHAEKNEETMTEYEKTIAKLYKESLFYKQQMDSLKNVNESFLIAQEFAKTANNSTQEYRIVEKSGTENLSGLSPITVRQSEPGEEIQEMITQAKDDTKIRANIMQTLPMISLDVNEWKKGNKIYNSDLRKKLEETAIMIQSGGTLRSEERFIALKETVEKFSELPQGENIASATPMRCEGPYGNYGIMKITFINGEEINVSNTEKGFFLWHDNKNGTYTILTNQRNEIQTD